MADHDLVTMRIALAEAQAAAARGEAPIGAAVFDPTAGKVVARAGNRSIGAADPTAHAEILTLRAAGAALGNYRLNGLELFITLEPSRHVRRRDQPRPASPAWCSPRRTPRAEPVLHGPRFFDQPTCHWRRPAVESGPLAEESATLLRAFFQARRL